MDHSTELMTAYILKVIHAITLEQQLEAIRCNPTFEGQANFYRLEMDLDEACQALAKSTTEISLLDVDRLYNMEKQLSEDVQRLILWSKNIKTLLPQYLVYDILGDLDDKATVLWDRLSKVQASLERVSIARDNLEMCGPFSDIEPSLESPIAPILEEGELLETPQTRRQFSPLELLAHAKQFHDSHKEYSSSPIVESFDQVYPPVTLTALLESEHLLNAVQTVIVKELGPWQGELALVRAGLTQCTVYGPVWEHVDKLLSIPQVLSNHLNLVGISDSILTI